MSPSGGLRGRRGSILGTAVQLGRRGYDSVHFFVELNYFFLELDAHIRSQGRGCHPRTDCRRVLCESKKKYLMPAKNGHIKSRYSSHPGVDAVF